MSSNGANIASELPPVLAHGEPPSKETQLHPQSSVVTSSTEFSSSSSSSSSDDEEETPVLVTGDNDDREHCETTSLCKYFSNATVDRMNERAREENEGLNLNLGLPVDLTLYTRRDTTTGAATAATNTAVAAKSVSRTLAQKVLRPPIRTLLCLLDKLLSLIESPLFHLWSDYIPLKVRQRLTFLAWGMYLPVHKALIGRRTGLHKNVSLEYHALTSVMWWGRLFPVTIKRMRFCLSQLHVWHPPDKYPQWSSIITTNSSSSRGAGVNNKPQNGERYGIHGHLYEVHHEMKRKRTPTGIRKSCSTNTSVAAFEEEELTVAEMTVTGQYIQHGSRPSEKVIFWIFGGAFLAGDSRGNLGIAEKMGMLCATGEEGGDYDHTNINSHSNNKDNGENGMRDVFIPDYRLVPEHHLDECWHDITLAYEYLIYERGIKPENVTLVGVSSGGGLVVLLLQALAKAKRDFEERMAVDGRDEAKENGDETGYVPMPAGGVMMGPFVDYTEPKGSMREYIKHDLIVNQSVFDEGIPYLEKVLGCHENRVKASPVYGNFEGLPPLCICVSQHEVVYDQSMILADRAREKGVDVTVGVWKYMCHVFSLLCPFVPEGQESFDFMCEWIRNR